jgi:ABC-type transport system involved in multi-copper enzyme maturation permease subunit
MAIWTIAGLTLKEAWRRRIALGSLLLGLLVLAFSLLLILIRARMSYLVATHDHGWDAERFAREYPNARILLSLMCLFFIRVLGMLFGLLLAGGAISGEIEAGLLAVILAKPIPRWHILAGKWLGLNVIATCSVLVWTGLVWLSMRMQAGFGLDIPLEQILLAGPYLALYAVMSCTLTLMFSTVFQRVLGTSFTLIIAVTSWCDGIFNFLGDHFSVPVLHRIADAACLLMPQGYVAWWIHDVTEDIAANPLGESPARSSLLLRRWGEAHLHFGHLDGVYVACYIIAVIGLGILLFQRREIHA